MTKFKFKFITFSIALISITKYIQWRFTKIYIHIENLKDNVIITKTVLIKRYVFSCFLKSSTEELHLIFSDSLFHNLGPATLNDLSANVLCFINVISSIFLEADLVLYATLCGDKRFDK